ncbi:hypothetical protein SAMN05444172_2610 [Burkholderia sp. GAS332]|nr:hypothetical protein SAMN05444172_2610 [Burkholderia sp. GAS332]
MNRFVKIGGWVLALVFCPVWFKLIDLLAIRTDSLLGGAMYGIVRCAPLIALSAHLFRRRAKAASSPRENGQQLTADVEQDPIETESEQPGQDSGVSYLVAAYAIAGVALLAYVWHLLSPAIDENRASTSAATSTFPALERDQGNQGMDYTAVRPREYKSPEAPARPDPVTANPIENAPNISPAARTVMRTTADQINSRAPVMLNSIARIDFAIAQGSDIWVYGTLVDVDASGLDGDVFVARRKAALLTDYCTSSESQKLRRLGIGVSYVYMGADQSHIATISVSPADCAADKFYDPES